MSGFKYALLREKEEQMPYFFWLSNITDLGIRKYRKVQSFFQTPKDLFNADYGMWEKAGVFTEKQLTLLDSMKKSGDIFEGYEDMQRQKIELIVCDDEKYPERLSEIPSPPPFIFKKGEIADLSGPVVSVIGARECSLYGSRVAMRIGELLADSQITLVSGMARGIDSISQDACLSAGGYSLGVLGGGVDICYPKESAGVYAKLERKGCIISEYPPKTNPKPQFFACRNRIISGLADVVCVVEARLKSGTMITVDSALEQGREVYALPGRITDVTSSGCNELIRQGAGIICSPEQLVEEILNNYSAKTNNYTKKETPKILCTQFDVALTDDEKKILQFFSTDSFTCEDLAYNLRMLPEKALFSCIELTKKHLLKSVGAGRFVKTSEGIQLGNSF